MMCWIRISFLAMLCRAIVCPSIVRTAILGQSRLIAGIGADSNIMVVETSDVILVAQRRIAESKRSGKYFESQRS